MENNLCMPTAYSGDAPFLFLSYAPENRSRAAAFAAALEKRGARFWYAEGIPAGFERDEVIGKKIMDCDFFISLLSPAYLEELDCTDELNFARDLNKTISLVYLEELTLPSGIAMRLTRTQSLQMPASADAALTADRILDGPGMIRFYGIGDPALAARGKKLFQKLEGYYPSHKVFGLDGLDSHLADALRALYVQTEFSTLDELMNAYGFSRIGSKEAVHERVGVSYTPGAEPEIVRSKVESAVASLEQLFPDRVVGESIGKKNGTLYERVYALSVWLGYENVSAFLSAYGFRDVYDHAAQGRRSTNHGELISYLQEYYQDKEKPFRVSEIVQEHPELRASIKTMGNNANIEFGMPLWTYLLYKGILRPREEKVTGPERLKRHRDALDRLKSIYSSTFGDEADARFESALSDLAGLVLRVSGEDVVLVRAEECPAALHLPYGVSAIAPGAFADTAELTELILPETVTAIAESAFENCENLCSVSLPQSLTEIGKRAFAGCTSLTDLHFFGALKTVREEAFADCTALEDVVFDSPRVSVYESAFSGCVYQFRPACDEGTDPNSFSFTVDKKNNCKITAYTGCDAVVYIPGMLLGHPVLSVEKGAFAGNAALKGVYMDDGIGAVQSEAFRDCINLEVVHLSNAITKFTSTVFAGCTAVREINVPDAVTELKRGAFKDMPLETVHLGKNLSALDPGAFYKGEVDPLTGKQTKGRTVRHVTVHPENRALRVYDTLILSGDGKTLLAELGETAALTIPEGVERIAPSACQRARTLTELTLPETLKEIGDFAFAEIGVLNVRFPDSLTKIGISAFSFCRSLENVCFGSGLKEIADQAFEGCRIENVTLPASLETLGANAFPILSLYQGEAARTLAVAEGNPFFFTDGHALYETKNGETVLRCGYDPAFRKPEANLTYAVREGTRQIAPRAFARCPGISEITLPDSMQTVGERAFWDCVSLTSLSPLPAGLSLGAFALQGTPLENKI